MQHSFTSPCRRERHQLPPAGFHLRACTCGLPPAGLHLRASTRGLPPAGFHLRAPGQSAVDLLIDGKPPRQMEGLETGSLTAREAGVGPGTRYAFRAAGTEFPMGRRVSRRKR